jgi:hypothetical protein
MSGYEDYGFDDVGDYDYDTSASPAGAEVEAAGPEPASAAFGVRELNPRANPQVLRYGIGFNGRADGDNVGMASTLVPAEVELEREGCENSDSGWT